jgi:hypothetical protein
MGHQNNAVRPGHKFGRRCHHAAQLAYKAALLKKRMLIGLFLCCWAHLAPRHHRHGRYHFTDQTRLLFGAKRPHVPLNCTLYRSEGIVRAELQWDHIMRFMNFTTNL